MTWCYLTGSIGRPPTDLYNTVVVLTWQLDMEICRMPLTRIDVNKNVTVDLIRIVSEAVYQGMIGPAKVPEHDRFQIVTRHSADELVYPTEGYMGLTYTRNLIYIQITWLSGRSTEQKRQFYRQVTTDIATKGKVRMEDIFITLLDTGKEDWSFGNGLMQYVPS